MFTMTRQNLSGIEGFNYSSKIVLARTFLQLPFEASVPLPVGP